MADPGPTVDWGSSRSAGVWIREHLPVRLIVHNAVTRTFVANPALPGRNQAAKFWTPELCTGLDLHKYGRWWTTAQRDLGPENSL